MSSHGGYLEPSELPDRDCQGCRYLRDAYTQEITRMAAEEIHRLTGCYPHVVYNLLHRKKLDANREIIEATDSTSVTEPPWYAFHEFIDSASVAIEGSWGKGLLIDMHGHAHTLQRLEMGMLLSDADLMLTDQEINETSLVEKSSCKHLINSNISSSDHVAILRGALALGSLLDTCGFPAIPSYNIPFLLPGEPHFNGGYITSRHGSRDAGTVDAIQIEGNNQLRFDPVARAAFADTLASKLLQYVEVHYFENMYNGFCGIDPSFDENIILSMDCIEIKKYPVEDWLVIDGLLGSFDISILHADGSLFATYENEGSRLAIDVSSLGAGPFLLRIQHQVKAELFIEKIIKI